MWVRSQREIREALDNQRKALIASCKAYDEGEKWEAMRLATAIWTVVHDGGRNNVSILSQLGVRGSLRFVSSAFKYSPDNVLRETALLSTRVYSDGTAEYRPLLDAAPLGQQHLLQIGKWWDTEVIFRDGQFRLTRRKLVFTLRSQEGGSHFDAVISDPNYLRFAKEQLTTLYVVSSRIPPKPILGAELASMRQIAWELLETLETLNEPPST